MNSLKQPTVFALMAVIISAAQAETIIEGSATIEHIRHQTGDNSFTDAIQLIVFLSETGAGDPADFRIDQDSTAHRIITPRTSIPITPDLTGDTEAYFSGQTQVFTNHQTYLSTIGSGSYQLELSIDGEIHSFDLGGFVPPEPVIITGASWENDKLVFAHDDPPAYSWTSDGLDSLFTQIIAEPDTEDPIFLFDALIPASGTAMLDAPTFTAMKDASSLSGSIGHGFFPMERVESSTSPSLGFAFSRGRFFDLTFAIAIGSPTPPTIQTFEDNGAGSYTLTWSAVPGAVYAVERSSDLKTWAELTRLTASGTTASHTLSRPEGQTSQFWRVSRIVDGE